VQYRQSQHLTLSSGPSPRKQLYAPVLSRVRVVMISRMAKPEEVRTAYPSRRRYAFIDAF
jgi:hypothetical protein